MIHYRKLTDRQRAALLHIADSPRGEATGYDLKVKGVGNLATLYQLAKRHLVAPIGHGHIAFPASATWQITNRGREAARQERATGG